MTEFLWIVVGVILLRITIFMHKHTYWKSRYVIPSEADRVRCPMWAAILVCIGAVIPVFNLILFVFGLCVYLGHLVGILGDEIVFYWDSPKWQRLMRFLTKEV